MQHRTILRLRWGKTILRDDSFHVLRHYLRGRHAFRLHTHDFAEVFWIEAGKGIHEVNGKRLPLTKGTLVTIRPNDCHGFRTDNGPGFTLVNVAFRKETIKFLRDRYFSKETGFFWASSKLPFQMHLHSTLLRWLREWTDYLARAPKTTLEIERFLLDLLHELSLHTGEIQQPQRGPDWLLHALEKIRDPQHFVLGTRELARLAGRCPEHVTRELKKRFGITATDAVNQARLEYAADQLKMTAKKIVEISLECGFQNSGHFYQLFQRRFGVTPRTYQMRHHAIVR